jgi:hypothetical protein
LSSDESDEDVSSDEDAETEEKVLVNGAQAAAILPQSTRAPRAGKELLQRQRSGDEATPCTKCSVIQCPRCSTTWEPDEKRHYSLLMGYGLKVHCQLCLFVFGCATAIHRCPFCPKTFEYDVSLYDVPMKCGGCKRTYHFPYFPVTQDMVDNIRASEREEEAKRRQQDERAERAAARSRTAADTEDEKLLELIGRCAVEEQCPICQKSVTRKHRDHVTECLKNPPPAKKAKQVRKFLVDDVSDDSDGGKKRSRRTPAASKSKLASKKKPAAPAATKKRPRRKASSDSD